MQIFSFCKLENCTVGPASESIPQVPTVQFMIFFIFCFCNNETQRSNFSGLEKPRFRAEKDKKVTSRVLHCQGTASLMGPTHASRVRAQRMPLEHLQRSARGEEKGGERVGGRANELKRERKLGRPLGCLPGASRPLE